MGAVSRYAPPLLLMGVIFLLSDQPSLDSGLGVLDFIARKLAHMAEFGLLFLLWLRALRFERPLVAVVIAVAYAVTDEWHQTAVPGRTGTPVDVLIDATGVAIAWWLWSRTATASRARWR